MIAVRGSWGQGFRAPSLAQIGLGPSQESLFFADTFGCAVNPAYCATTDYTVIFSGNPDLEAEESETFNFGVSISPMEGLQVSLDYWDITQEKKIDDVPFGFLYNSFCNNQNSTVCVRGTPQPGEALGPLQSVSTSFINIGEQSATGIDLSASYTADVGAGTLGLNLYYAYLMDFDRVELDSSGANFVTRSLAGEYEYPESRWSLGGTYTLGDWAFASQLDYVGEFEDTPDIDFDGVLDYDTNVSRTVDSYLTVNAQVSYSGFENTRLMFGVDNLFDEEPPFAIGDGDSDLYLSQFDVTLYYEVLDNWASTARVACTGICARISHTNNASKTRTMEALRRLLFLSLVRALRRGDCPGQSRAWHRAPSPRRRHR